MAKDTIRELPGPLNTEAFRKAWDEWKQHRTEIRKKLTPLAVKKSWKRLEEMGHDAAIEAIEYSIGNGWTGIFQPDGKGKRASPVSRVSAKPGKYDHQKRKGS